MNNRAFSKIGIIVILVVLVAGGIFAWQYFRVSKEGIGDQTADWKIYTNTKYNYQLKAPQDFWNKAKPSAWVDSSNDDSIWFYRGHQWYIMIDYFPDASFYNPSLGTELVGWLKENEMLLDNYQNLEKPNFEIGGIPAVRMYSPERPQAFNADRIYLIKDNKLFQIQVLADTDDENSVDVKDVKEICNQMLSTFRFIEAEEPYIKVLSPDGGEEWMAGKTYDITWASKGIDEVGIDLKLMNLDGTFNNSWKIATVASPKESYSWEIPLDQSLASTYKIVLIGDLAKAPPAGVVQDESDNYFSIIYTPMVELRDVINYYDPNEVNYVRTTGIIVGLEYGDYSGSILLSDNSDYLLVAISHATIDHYKDILAGLQQGDKIEVQGNPSFTSPKVAGLKEKFNLPQDLPETIGMLTLDLFDGIKKIE